MTCHITYGVFCLGALFQACELCSRSRVLGNPATQVLRWFSSACHPKCGCMHRAPPHQVIAGLPKVSNGLPPQSGCMPLRPLTLICVLFFFVFFLSLPYWASRWVSCQPLRLVPDVTSQQVQSAPPPRLPARRARCGMAGGGRCARKFEPRCVCVCVCFVFQPTSYIRSDSVCNSEG